MSTTMNNIIGLSDGALAAPGSTDVAQDLMAAGNDFGALMVSIGTAVGITQQKLTETSADTAKKMASTLVDVIAVQETIYDEDGNPTDSLTFKQKLPLINFVDPVFYEYPQVRVQGEFWVDDFSTESSASSNVSASKSGFGLGLVFNTDGAAFALGGGSASGSVSTNVHTTSDRDVSIGRMRMNARIAPTGLTVPKPLQIVRGPSLSVIEGAITRNNGANNKPASVTMSLTIHLAKRDGTPINGQPLSIDTGGTLWDYNPADVTTDPNHPNDKVMPKTGDGSAGAGNVRIILTRVYEQPLPDDPNQDPDTTPQPVIVTARLGLITNSTTVTF